MVSFKSADTEEWLDVWFTRPIGLVFALLWNKLGIHPIHKYNQILIRNFHHFLLHKFLVDQK